ncbi:MAG: nitroreductase family protein [Coriobacteriales bacterium]|jgi:nitroreductase
METMDAIIARHSTRAFTDEPVTEDQLNKILAAADASPIGMKMNDNFHLTVITDKKILGEIASGGDIDPHTSEVRDPIYGAPLLIIVSGREFDMAPGIEIADASCVIENILIAATDLGLENIFLWGFIHRMLPGKPQLLEALQIPEGMHPICAAAIGHGVEKPTPGGHAGLEKTFLK